MTGCRYDGKNTLDKNYLYLARKKGLRLQADSEVIAIEPLKEGGYRVTALKGRSVRRRKRVRRTFTAQQVVLSAGALGTVDLLLRLKRDPNGLPAISDCLGTRVRTNSESLIGVVVNDRKQDWSKGIAIGSILQTDKHSHLEVVRYGAGSGLFRLGMAPHVGGRAPGAIKVIKALLHLLLHPLATLRAYLVRDWAKYTIILLYMRALEGTLRFRLKRGLFGTAMGSELEAGDAPTASIPEATELAAAVAARTGGFVGSLLTETALNIPSTAHILGGCCMGKDSATGVIDHRHAVFGYSGLYIIDGSTMSANPGVNPALTITAMAERAITMIPAKHEPESAAS